MDKNVRSLRFPQDILRLAYWVFFKPITLQNYISKIDPALSRNSDPSLLSLWKRRKEHPEFLSLIWLSLLNIVFMPMLAFPLCWIFQLAGYDINWFKVAVVVAVGVAGGVAVGVAGGVAIGVAEGVAAVVAFGVAIGVAFGVAVVGVVLGVAVAGVAAGVAIGVAVGGVAAGLTFGMAAGVAFGVAGGVAVGVAVGVVLGVVLGRMFGMAEGVAVVGVAFIMNYIRLPLYLFYSIWSLAQSRKNKHLSLTGSPVFYDELIWFPLPGLDSVLYKIGRQDRQQGMQAIAFVAGSFKQGWAARRALLNLTAYDVEQSHSLAQIAEIAVNLSWLPDDARTNMQELLLGLEQTSQHARAALESETLYNKQEQLRMGIQVIGRIQSGLAYAEKSELARQLLPALASWKTIFSQELVQAIGIEQIPNVYHSSTPLIKDSKTFKGRLDLFKSLGNELVNPSGQRPALLLFGARRMGKSSTLKQLPAQLGPQIIPVTIDLQFSTAVENTASLLYLLAREIIRSARLERHLVMPELNRDQLENDPYLVFQDWLEAVEKVLGDYYWILLALDEFEALGEMLEAGRTDERIFQTLRGLMQNHPRITVMMSGAHTLEELPPFWSNYLINTRMLKVGPLENADARELILRPIPDFPLTYDEDAVELLIQETGCHPNWLQFTCREVVEAMNTEKRFHANRGDVETALGKVPQVLAGDFKDLWEGRDSSDLMRLILKSVASARQEAFPESKMKKIAKANPDFQKTLDYILRRDLLVYEESAYHFRAGLLRRWVGKQQ